jgi:alkylation response protein AidB-like acyl-CoA dehydrogenase
MAKFDCGLRDIFFNLFEHNRVQDQYKDLSVDEMKEILREFDKFIAAEFYPCRESSDAEGVKLVDGHGVKVPESFQIVKKNFYENGWFGLGLSEDVGGMPAPESLSFACKSIATGANVSFSMYPDLTRAALNLILAVGSEEQKNLCVQKMVEGSWGGTMCLTESNAGSDVGAVRTKATKNDDGTYQIQGVKIFISSGENDLYENIAHLVLARTEGAAEGPKGLSLFIVTRYKTDAEGNALEDNDVFCTKLEEKMGLHAQATCELTFGGNNNCQGVLLGEEFDGMKNMFLMMNEARLLCALQGESQATLMAYRSLEYAKERSQFGTEIINHPDVIRLLNRVISMSRGLRAMNFYVGHLFDRVHNGETELNDEIGLLIPICKSFSTDEVFQVGVDAMQIFGGYGFCSEYGIEQFLRDSKIASIYEGTNGIQAADLVMRKILKDGGSALTSLMAKMGKDIEGVSIQESEKTQISLMKNSMAEISKIMAHYSELAKQKKFDQVLYSSYNFLNYLGNIVVSWQLLLSADIATKALEGELAEEESSFYQSKINDYRNFCRHFLIRNKGISSSILDFEEFIQKIEV